MKPFRYSLSLLLLFTACSEPKVEPTGKQASTEAAKLALAADPGEAISVLDAKAKGKADSIVVQGRVHELTPGFAVMKLMDTELKYCGEVHAENCPTPWDFCCDSKDRRMEHSLLVEVRGKDGKPLATAALPNTRLCDLMKVRGKLVTDEHGSPVLIADGIYQVERPELPDFVKWPE